MSQPQPAPIDPAELPVLAQKAMKAAKFPMLATVDGVQPRLRPVSPVRTEGFTVYVANLRSYGKTAEIAGNPQVELCYCDEGHDQVRITGTAEIVKERPVLEEIWNSNPLLRAYLRSIDNPELIIYKIIPNRVRYMKEWALEYHEVPVSEDRQGMKLDRFLSRHDALGRASALRLIASRRVRVDGVTITDGHHVVDRFSRIEVDGNPIQADGQALYMMLHKPVGHVSATSDDELPTVLDLIDHPGKNELHLAGRLDRNTSGLVLLTNDGRWSKRITESALGVPKVYLVDTAEPIQPGDVEAFANGFYFHTEDIVTKPAVLEIVGERRGRLTLVEGRYHQVKRMFHRVNNRVTGLHRESIGSIVLMDDLPPGTWRCLTPDEVASF